MIDTRSIARMKARRAAIAASTGVALTLGVVALTIAGGNDPQFAAPINEQAFVATDDEATTSNSQYRKISSLSLDGPCKPGKSGVSATLSLETSGGEAQVRVLQRKRVLKPGPVTVDTSQGRNASSFTFVRSVRSRLEGPFHVEWRSVTGEALTFHQGTLRLLYQAQRGGNPCF